MDSGGAMASFRARIISSGRGARSARRVFQHRVERAHRDFVAPGRGARSVREVIAVLILLQREAFTRPRRAGDVAFSTFDGMADALLNRELLETRELFGARDAAYDLIEIHGTGLADHRLDARIVGGDLDDVAAAEARAPETQAISIDLCLQGQPGESVAVILHLIVGEDALPRLAAAPAQPAKVERQRRDAGRCEPTGKRLQIHFLHVADTVGHGNRGHALP